MSCIMDLLVCQGAEIKIIIKKNNNNLMHSLESLPLHE